MMKTRCRIIIIGIILRLGVMGRFRLHLHCEVFGVALSEFDRYHCFWVQVALHCCTILVSTNSPLR
jgi:hypothetical protein